MAREIVTEIDIDATATTVWKKLVDLPGFAAWNPLITRAAGTVEEGQRLTLRLEPPGAEPFELTPTVSKVVVEQEIRWTVRAGLPGIFDREHALLIEPAPGAKTRLVQKESFAGLRAGGQWAKLEGPLRQGFEAMNAALKELAESSAPNN
jgi:hypothetical protein